MKNAFKTIGIIFIIAAALFIAACGPIAEPDPTVTENSDGSLSVDKGATPTKPEDPVKIELADPGFYKNFTGYTFDGWFDADGNEFTTWGVPTETAVTLKPKFSIPAGVKQDLTSTTGDNDVTKAFAYINALNNIPATDKYTLFIGANVAPTATTTLVLTASNANLTIMSANEREIKSPNLSSTTLADNKEFIVVGKATGGTANDNIKLTLKDIVVAGSKVPTSQALIRVKIGGELILENKSTVADHINNIGLKVNGVDPTNTGGGVYGNGAAICVFEGGILTVKAGANIVENESTGDQSNKNLVGGVYAIGTKTSKSTVNIEGGYIGDNKCVDGNTADIYITETVKLTMHGNLTIGELCINADDPDSIDSNTLANFIAPDFIITGPVTNTIKKFNLRSTKTTLANVQDAWTKSNVKVFSGTMDYDITPADVAQFKLWEFTGRQSLRGTGTGVKPDDETTWANYIDPAKYKIDIIAKASNVPNYGKLVTITTP